jgi:hypothetical protein
MLSNSWLFAEGSVTQGFANYFLVFNPNQTPSTLEVMYYRDASQPSDPIFQHVTVPPQTRITIDANGVAGLTGRDFSTTIVSTNSVPVVAERAMYWGPNWVGGTASLGATYWSKDWYFAEGAAATNFESFYLLMNPNTFPISVTARLMPEGSAPYREETFTIEPRARYTYHLNSRLGEIGGVAAHFTSTQFFLAERSIYWTNRIEGTNVVGVNAPAREWHLPEGTTGGLFTTYLLLSNPTDASADVNMTLFIEGPTPRRITAPALHLAPRTRISINMADMLRSLEPVEGPLVGSSFSTKLSVQGQSQGAIVAEHSIFWNPVGPGLYWHGGSGSFGIPVR